MKYHDMDDGQNFLYFATGVPPQEHLDDIKYKAHTSKELYRRVIRGIKERVKPSVTLMSALRKVGFKRR